MKSFLAKISLKLSKDRQKVLSNFVALGLVQGTNFLIPLLVFPYLIRVLGAEKFGVIVFAQTFIQYLIIVTDYGFNLSATREISLNRNNTKKISEIFNAVLHSKLVLTILAFVVLVILLIFVPKFRNEYEIYLLGFPMVVGQALLPVWFFQGIEQMRFLTYFNLASRLSILLMIILFIKETNHYSWVLFFYSVGYLIAGVMSLFVVYKFFNITLQKPQFSQIKEQLKEGWHIFLSIFSVSFYTNLHIIILGFFTSDKMVGFYGIAEKLMIIVKTLTIIFNQSIYPRACQLVDTGFKQTFSFLSRMSLFFSSLLFFVCLLIFLFAEQIIFLLMGNYSVESVLILRIIIFAPFITSLHLPIANIFLVYHKNKLYSSILILAAFLSLISNIIFAYLFQGRGVAFTTLSIEIIVTVIFFIQFVIINNQFDEIPKKT